MSHSLMLKLEQLNMRYPQTGNTRVGLHDINLEIERGECLVLMGPSGSGKSSLLRCLNGLNGRETACHLQGRILFSPETYGETYDLTSCSSATLRVLRSRHMACVFQSPALLPWLSVFANAAFPLELRGEKKLSYQHRVWTMLERMGLKDFAEALPHTLSGGMKQRVSIARAWLSEAPLILMDEPFSALDPQLRKQMHEDLQSLHADFKKTIILVSHDPSEARQLAQRIAILKQGRLLQVDTLTTLLTSSHQHVRSFMKAAWS